MKLLVNFFEESFVILDGDRKKVKYEMMKDKNKLKGYKWNIFIFNHTKNSCEIVLKNS